MLHKRKNCRSKKSNCKRKNLLAIPRKASMYIFIWFRVVKLACDEIGLHASRKQNKVFPRARNFALYPLLNAKYAKSEILFNLINPRWEEKLYEQKKATASEKTSLENDSQKCERVHHFISGVALVSSFHFEVGLQSPCPTLHQRQKRHTFSAEERVVLSLQCSMCANFAFFVGLFLKGMRAIMGNSFLGTHTATTAGQPYHELKSFLRRQSQQAACHGLHTTTGPECRFLPSTLYKTEV